MMVAEGGIEPPTMTGYGPVELPLLATLQYMAPLQGLEP